MRRINATLDIASMANLFALWNRAFEFPKDDPVCEILPSDTVFSPSDLWVAVRSDSSGVEPAFGFKIDLDSNHYPLPRKEGFN
jgi:hypothetical protein